MAVPGTQSTIKVGVEFVPDVGSLKSGTDRAMKGITDSTGRLRATSEAFGALTTNARAFDQQLERANKRVLALGASVTIIYGAVRAFRELVLATANVEKNLITINTVFQLSTRELDTFGKSLSSVARQTGQALDDVSKAALEFARQGLSMAETSKRTRDAMILVRLTGLDVVKAVDTMTAAMNTFGKTGVDTTVIVNKLVAVDRAFAVSAKDIAEAFARVGSVADDANVSLDEFTGLVTAARQITSRAGTVIGNSLKTIFTRLERSSTLEQLESFGIAVRDASGNAKSAMEVFNTVAASYKNLNREQQQQIAELGAGVFQINQFKALLLDLGKANGVAAQATKISTNATNEALIANALLNNTLSTSLQNLQTSATTAAAVVGKLSVERGLKQNISVVQELTGFISQLSTSGDTKAAEDFGNYLGESILKGIGAVLAGPGSIFISKAIIGLVGRTYSETRSDIVTASNFPRDFVGKFTSGFAGRGRTEEISSLQTVNGLLAQGTAAEQKRYQAATTLADQERIILGILEKQVTAMARMGGAAPAITSLRRSRSVLPGAAGGYIPIAEESAAIGAGVGGAPASARPVYLPSFNRGGGARGIVANTSEFIVPGAAGGAIYNRDMIRKYGLPAGATPVAAGGYIPNAAEGQPRDPFTGRFAPLPPFGIGLSEPGVKELNEMFKNISRAAISLRSSPALSKGPNVIGSVGFPSLYLPKQSGPSLAQTNESLFGSSFLPLAANRAIASQASLFAANQMLAGRRIDPFSLPVPSTIGYGRRAEGLGSHLLGGAEMYGPTRDREGYWAMAGRNRARIEQYNLNKSPEEQRRIQADLKADKVRYELRQQQAEQQALQQSADRRARMENRAGRLQQGLLVGSLATGFLPEVEGGTLKGQGTAALSGGLQGGAIGASIGSFFGAPGIIAGALIGGFGAAIKGFIDKSRKSFDELAKELEDANAKSAKIISGASQFRNIQGNIREAIERGRGGDVVNTLFRQQRAAVSELPADVLRQLLEAGFDEEKQGDVFSKLTALDAEQRSSRNLSGAFKGLTEPKKLGKEGIRSLATSLRSVTGATDGTSIRSLLGRVENAGGKNKVSDPRNLLEATVDAIANKDGGNNKLATDIRSEIESIVNGANLSQSQKDEFSGYIKQSKISTIIDLLQSFQEAGDTGPSLDVAQQGGAEIESIRVQYNNLLRLRGREESLGGVRSQFQNRLAGTRERAALGLGGLGENETLALSGRFAIGAAEREAGLSNATAFQSARARFAQTAVSSGYGAKQVAGVEGAASIEDFQKIADAAFGDDLKKSLNEVVTELRVTVEQNNSLIAITKEEARLSQLQLEAQQQQRLLSSGTLGTDTGASARSLFSRFRNTGGAAGATNAINLSSFLSQVGLPQTNEGEAFERGARASSVRDTMAAILSARTGRNIRPDDIEAANAELAKSSSYGDVMLSGRISEGLNRLKFDPAAERAKLIAGGSVNAQTLGQLDTGTLVLRAPLESISKSSQDSLDIQRKIESNTMLMANREERLTLALESVRLQGLIQSGGLDPATAAQYGERVSGLKRKINALDIDSSYEAYPLKVTVMNAVAEGTKDGMIQGAKEAVKEDAVKMSPFNVSAGRMGSSGRAGGGGGLFGFGTGVRNSLESAVKEGRFTSIEEAMRNLESVGQRVGASLEQNLGNAFGDFVTGAQKGKDAFRSFVLGVLNDSARAMASKAVQQLLGFILTSAFGAAGSGGASSTFNVPVGTSAQGGFIGMANGGKVPTLLTGGEYAFSPSAAKRVGASMLTGLNQGTIRKMAGGGALVKGGSGVRDDVPAMLSPGTFVVKKAMTERYGVPFLSALAEGGATLGFSSGGDVGSTVTIMASPVSPIKMAGGGSVSSVASFLRMAGGGAVSSSSSTPFLQPIQMAGGGMLSPNGVQMLGEGGMTTTVMASPAGGFGGGGTFNIGVNITDQRTTSTSSSQGSPGGGSVADRQFGETLALRMKQVALQTIEEQTRLGGVLRRA